MTRVTRRLLRRRLREIPSAGVQVMSTRMADDYTPPSASLNPAASRDASQELGGAPSGTPPESAG